MIFAITSDVDFVSDSVLEYAYSPFKNLPLTIFQTGKSQYLDTKIKAESEWELEPHPNFCNGSTQGKTQDEVFKSIEKYSGQSFGFRCHRYYYSNDIAEKFREKGFKYSSNVCTDTEYVKPFCTRCGLIEFPIFCEDGGYLKYHGVPRVSEIAKKFTTDGLYVFNFHPIHIAMNTCDFSLIRHLKDSIKSDEYSAMTYTTIKSIKNQKYGIENFLTELIEYAQKHNIELMNLHNCYERYKSNNL